MNERRSDRLAGSIARAWPAVAMGIALAAATARAQAPAPAAPGGEIESQPESEPATDPTEVVPEPPEPPPPVPITVTAEPGRGLTVSAGDVFAATLRARVQIRNTLRVDGSAVDDVFEIRTARIWWTGHVLDPQLRYGLQLALGANDFESGNASPIFDAFVETTHLRELNVRVGQFFVPFDRARTIREFSLQTVDRTDVVRELTLDRDVGIVLSSTDVFGLGGRLAYWVGFFGGDGRNRLVTASQQTPDVGFLYTARISVRPMGAFDDDAEGDLTRSPAPRLALGAGVAFNHRTDRPRSTTGTIDPHARFDYVHAAADLVFKWYGVSLLGEVVYREATDDAVDWTDPATMTRGTSYARNGWGYLAQLGVMVHESVELWGRWEHLEPIRPVATDAIRSQRGIGGGLNVYLRGHALKIQADWAHTFGDDVLTGPHLIRLQLDASF